MFMQGKEFANNEDVQKILTDVVFLNEDERLQLRSK